MDAKVSRGDIELAGNPALDVARIRADFPILSARANGKPLVYLDNAATSQKPRAVLDAMNEFWVAENANVHRGVHYLSQISTTRYDGARDKVARFINAARAGEIVFTKGCTEAINLVATSMSRGISPNGSGVAGKARLGPGDEILVSNMEHHTNIVPWQIAADVTGAVVRVIPITDDGELDLDAYERMLSERVKVVAIVHVSNSVGTVNPVKSVADLAHRHGALVVVDGAQAGPHLRIDVQDLDADFYALSCHKMYAPTGVGVLYGKWDLLLDLPPYQGGGDMITSVSFGATSYALPPARFEAGTPNVGGVVGLAAALDYLEGMRTYGIHEYETELARYAAGRIAEIPGVRIVGAAAERASIVSFVMDDVHPHDIGTILDSEGIAIRAGHHCTQPLMERLGHAATARASFAFYNTFEEADALVRGLGRVKEVFA